MTPIHRKGWLIRWTVCLGTLLGARGAAVAGEVGVPELIVDRCDRPAPDPNDLVGPAPLKLPHLIDLSSSAFAVWHPEVYHSLPTKQRTAVRITACRGTDGNVILVFDVADATLVLPRAGGTDIEKSDHCELWICDSSGTTFSQLGFSPGDFGSVRPFAYQWYPGPERPTDNIAVASYQTKSGYMVGLTIPGRMFGNLQGSDKTPKVSLAVLDVRGREDRSRDCMVATSPVHRLRRCETFNAMRWKVGQEVSILSGSPDGRFAVVQIDEGLEWDPAIGEMGTSHRFLVDRKTGRATIWTRSQSADFSGDGEYMLERYSPLSNAAGVTLVRLTEGPAPPDLKALVDARIDGDPTLPAWLKARHCSDHCYIGASWYRPDKGGIDAGHKMHIVYESYTYEVGNNLCSAHIEYNYVVGGSLEVTSKQVACSPAATTK